MSINFKGNMVAEFIQNILFSFIGSFLNKRDFPLTLNGNLAHFDSICGFICKNKKILMNKSGTFFKFLDKHMNNMKLDLSFLENIDIEKFIEKFEQLYSNSYISLSSNDVRKRVIEKFKKMVEGASLLYIVFIEVCLNYSFFSSNIMIVRAPPKLLFINNSNCANEF